MGVAWRVSGILVVHKPHLHLRFSCVKSNIFCISLRAYNLLKPGHGAAFLLLSLV